LVWANAVFDRRFGGSELAIVVNKIKAAFAAFIFQGITLL